MGDRRRASRIAVAPEPLLDGATYDYADSFEIRLEHPDTHTAEEWARVALEHSPPPVRRLIQFVHRHVVRFQLGPDSHPDYVLGWRVVMSTSDVLHLQTAGPLLRADLVARRPAPTSAVVTTFLFYERPFTRLLWLVVGPLHRRIAPYLLDRAASSLGSGTSADV